jgi:NADPH:quinone reductase-like Zn-dependent oxidoreductase
LGADAVLAIDDKAEIEKLGFVDAVADTVGGTLAGTLIGKVKPGGRYGSTVGPPSNAALHPTVTVAAFSSKPDGAALQMLASEVATGKFRIPIDRMIPLSDAAKGHAAAEKGGIGKVLLLT